MKLRNAVKAVAFCGIFVAMFLGIQSIFLPKSEWQIDTAKYPVFYDLEEDVIDALFLGSSTDYMSIYPMELYANYGIRSFNLGSPNQSMQQSYYQLLEASKTQKIKYCFLEVRALFHEPEDTEWAYAQKYKMMVSMPLSKNKVDLILSYTDDSEKLLELLVPLYKFHNRWNELTKSDFDCDVNEKYTLGYGALYMDSTARYLGYSTQYRPSEITMTKEYEDTFLEREDNNLEQRVLETEVNDEECDYFEKIFNFCNANGIILVPIKGPSIVSWGEKRHQIAEEYLAQYDLELLDFMYAPNKVDIDWSTDTCDGGLHCNFKGGLKVTDYIGQWILENCSGLRINEDFASKEQWDADAAAYEELKADLLLSMRTDTQKAHDLFAELSADQSKYILILSVKNDMSVLWNGKLEEDMRSIGLKEEFTNHGQQSYIAVIDRGENVFERFSPDSLIYKGTFEDDGIHSLYIKSENYKQGDSSRILIDGKEYSMNTPGLNIVVYDCEENRVVRQAAINLTVNPFKYYEK